MIIIICFILSTGRDFNVECTEVPGGVKIRPINKTGYAYLGVIDVTDKAQVAEASKVEIKYLIWHEESYKGGGNYGKFGGV